MEIVMAIALLSLNIIAFSIFIAVIGINSSLEVIRENTGYILDKDCSCSKKGKW